MSIWGNPFVMESKVADIISNQARHGCNFNKRQASWYIHVLSEKVINIDIELVPMLPKMLNTNNKSHYKRPFKLNGEFMGYVQRYADKVGLNREEVGGPFSPVWFTDFDPSKTAKVKDTMLGLGWRPTEWNQKKQSFDARKMKKMLRGSKEFGVFLNKLHPVDREELNKLINGFVEKHFKNRPVEYMRRVLEALNFSTRVAPTFDEIKIKLVSSQFWPTSPKITEDSLDEDTDNSGQSMDSLGLLLKRMQWSHRRSLLEGLIKNVRRDGKLEGGANPCATPTARMRHRVIVNIPAGGAVFGHECRGLFIGDINNDDERKPVIIKNDIPKGARLKSLTNIIQEQNKKGEWEDIGCHKIYLPEDQDAFVGGDGAGLELRMLAHYLVWVCKDGLKKNPNSARFKGGLKAAYEYREQILDGDIHTHNQNLAGLPTRFAAKRFIYAFLYGAGDVLLGELVEGGSAEGKAIRATFLSECPCIPILIEWAQEFASMHGYLPALDGRKLIMRRNEKGEVMTHKALNTLLQAAGSIVMKYAMLFLHDWIKRDKLSAKQVIMMHKSLCM